MRSEFTNTKSVHSDGQRQGCFLQFTDGESQKEADREGEGERRVIRLFLSEGTLVSVKHQEVFSNVELTLD